MELGLGRVPGPGDLDEGFEHAHERHREDQAQEPEELAAEKEAQEKQKRVQMRGMLGDIGLEHRLIAEMDHQEDGRDLQEGREGAELDPRHESADQRADRGAEDRQEAHRAREQRDPQRLAHAEDDEAEEGRDGHDEVDDDEAAQIVAERGVDLGQEVHGLLDEAAGAGLDQRLDRAGAVEQQEERDERDQEHELEQREEAQDVMRDVLGLVHEGGQGRRVHLLDDLASERKLGRRHGLQPGHEALDPRRVGRPFDLQAMQLEPRDLDERVRDEDDRAGGRQIEHEHAEASPQAAQLPAVDERRQHVGRREADQERDQRVPEMIKDEGGARDEDEDRQQGERTLLAHQAGVSVIAACEVLRSRAESSCARCVMMVTPMRGCEESRVSSFER